MPIGRVAKLGPGPVKYAHRKIFSPDVTVQASAPAASGAAPSSESLLGTLSADDVQMASQRVNGRQSLNRMQRREIQDQKRVSRWAETHGRAMSEYAYGSDGERKKVTRRLAQNRPGVLDALKRLFSAFVIGGLLLIVNKDGLELSSVANAFEATGAKAGFVVDGGFPNPSVVICKSDRVDVGVFDDNVSGQRVGKVPVEVDGNVRCLVVEKSDVQLTSQPFSNGRPLGAIPSTRHIARSGDSGKRCENCECSEGEESFHRVVVSPRGRQAIPFYVAFYGRH